MTEPLAQAAQEMIVNARLEVVLGGVTGSHGYLTRLENDQYRFTVKRGEKNRPYNRFVKAPIQGVEFWDFGNPDFLLLTEWKQLQANS